MRKFFALMLAAIFFLTGCGEVKEVQADVLPPPPPPDPIETKLNSMTLEEKIGQMVMIGVYGTELNDDIVFSMNNFHFGGVIFFDRNLESVAQAKKFANDIEAVANQKAPLFFALDEEGGRV
ncbi:MAG: glycoside hydrolase family 3 protein, partial [Selenomonadaceae bacterium]|nr:glycoside hydrolase family 3 protein [Selenomonadaceae bacterium]